MKAHIKELHITVALPASGKSTWAKEMAGKARRGLALIDTDYWLRDAKMYESMETLLVKRCSTMDKITIIDGLFLNQSDIIHVVNILKRSKVSIEKVFIQYWEVDREKCLWNDQHRREESSDITIKTADVDDFNDITKIKEAHEDIKFEVIKNTVTMKEPYVVFADQYKIRLDDDGNYKGESWCNGGTWRDCWEMKVLLVLNHHLMVCQN